MRHIGDFPPQAMYREGVEIDCQCARCGSSCDFMRCEFCDDGYVEDDFGDDVCPDVVLVKCQDCHGRGGWNRCLSSPEWCRDNPMKGREKILRGNIEWFTIEREEREA